MKDKNDMPPDSEHRYELRWDGGLVSPYLIVDRLSRDYKGRRELVESFKPLEYGGPDAALQAAKARLAELNYPLEHIAKQKADAYPPPSDNHDPQIIKYGRSCYMDGFIDGVRWANGEQ